jgi:hypothetical protein
MDTEPEVNPLHSVAALQQAPRCNAHSKRTGQPCRSPAVRGWEVCRMHGARGGAPPGVRNGRFRTGQFTAEVVNAGRLVRAMARMAGELEGFDDGFLDATDIL